MAAALAPPSPAPASASASSPLKVATSAASTAATLPSYHAEIASMVYVLTATRPSPDSAVVEFIQDVVRQHLVKLVMAAKLQALRTSRTRPVPPAKLPLAAASSSAAPLGPTAVAVHIQLEDLLFVVRRDRAKLERLKLYLGWKDVRKKTRAEPATTTAAGDDDDLDGIEEPDKKEPKVGKSRIHLSWELQEPWIDYLGSVASHSSAAPSRSSTPPPSLPAASGAAATVTGLDLVPLALETAADATATVEDLDEPTTRGMSVEERRAYRINREVLREANELTESMTRDEYEQYSTARQASFVYRKGKKFRDFLLVDQATTLSEELLDVLGFLAYELVRTLCRAGTNEARLRVAHANRQVERERDASEAATAAAAAAAGTRKRKLDDGYDSKTTTMTTMRDGPRKKENGDDDADNDDNNNAPLIGGSNDLLDPNLPGFPSVLRPVPTTTTTTSSAGGSAVAPAKKKKQGSRGLEPIVSLFSAPIDSGDLVGRDDESGGAANPGAKAFGASSQAAAGAANLDRKQNLQGGSPTGGGGTERDVAAAIPVTGLEMRDLLDGFYRESTLATMGSLAGSGDKSAMGKGLRGWRGGIGAVRGGASLM